MLKINDQVFRVFMKWKILTEKQTYKKLKRLHNDNGGEFTSNSYVMMKASVNTLP